MTHSFMIAHNFPDPPDNNELEGITVNTSNDHVVVDKECQPGLLIELDSSLTKILSTRMLQANLGLIHPKLKADKLDFSGLIYDSSSDSLWIVSDKGECLFHQYDWTREAVLQHLDLTINTGDKPRWTRKPKGVAIDPDRKRCTW